VDLRRIRDGSADERHHHLAVGSPTAYALTASRDGHDDTKNAKKDI